MSHFTVLVIGDNPEDQLAPYQENNMDDCPKEYLEFEDIEEQYREEFETELAHEFYCASSCSWGQKLSDESYDVIAKLPVGGCDNIYVDTKLHYFKMGRKYQCYPKSKDSSYPKEYHIWIEVIKVPQHPDKDVCFNGVIQVKRIEPPKKLPLKKIYTVKYMEAHKDKLIGGIDEELIFEYFMDNWAGIKKDPNIGKYGYWENPNAKWDWYKLGGRWTGFFKLKSGKEGSIGSPGLMTVPANPGYADQCKKSDIDIEEMRFSEANRAAERYDKVHKIIGLESLKYKWSDLLEKVEANEISIGEARALYNSQKFIKKFREEIGFDDAESFLIDRDDYIKNHVNSTLSTFAVLKDGKWYERGKMGWWGIVMDEKNDWDAEFHKLFDSLPDDTMLSVYDCHI